jgi:NAD(P)-dependent dehydrogenase (short-subunit alcohol dehydrogenase family)
MQINVFSIIYMVQAALPYLRIQGGRVVATSSGASSGEFAGLGLYGMTKAAQNCLVRTLAEEEKGNNVFAFAVMPGMIDVNTSFVSDDEGPLIS